MSIDTPLTMTSSRMLRVWNTCLIGATLLQAVVVISTSGTSCTPEVECNPPVVELANLSFPLRQLNVSSTCGTGNYSSQYCTLENTAACSGENAPLCSGQYTAEHMLDWTLSADYTNPHLPTYWQSENTIADDTAEPTPQYVQVSYTTVCLSVCGRGKPEVIKWSEAGVHSTEAWGVDSETLLWPFIGRP